MRKGRPPASSSFALWFVVRAVPFLDRERPATYATPNVQPTDPASLWPIAVKGGQSVCADQIPGAPTHATCSSR